MSLFIFLILSITEGAKKPPVNGGFLTSFLITIYEEADKFFRSKNRHGPIEKIYEKCRF